MKAFSTIRNVSLILVAPFVGAVLADTASAIFFPDNTYNPALSSRFYVGNDRAFIGDPLDLTGVGHSNPVPTINRWVMMISDQYFLTSAHTGPQVDVPVLFYPTNDINDPPTSVSIDTQFAGQRIGDSESDLWLGKLAENAPSWAARYALISRPEAGAYYTYVDPKIYVLGFRGGTDPQYYLGLNDIESKAPHGEFAWTDSPASDPNGYGPVEASTRGGDSSGPSFVLTSSEYPRTALAGVHHSEDGDSSISAHISEIKALVPSVQIVTDLPGDLNHDFVVKDEDLAIVLANWGVSTHRADTGDANNDGLVDDRDLTVVLSEWGKKVKAPVDFNSDYNVDRSDFDVIASHWGTGTIGDVSGSTSGQPDGVVGRDDVVYLNKFWIPSTFPGVVPGIAFPGDGNNDGFVNGEDIACASNHICDANHDGVIDENDDSDLASANNNQGTIYFDLNHDGKIGLPDLDIIIGNYKTDAGLAGGDFNQDHIVNSADIALLQYSWGHGSTYVLRVGIPEPCTFSMLSVASFVLMSFRKKKREYKPRELALHQVRLTIETIEDLLP